MFKCRVCILASVGVRKVVVVHCMLLEYFSRNRGRLMNCNKELIQHF